jgi:hypothetical protein
MRLPIIRRAIMKPYAFQGDFLVKCISKSRKLMENAVIFIELVSKDIELENHRKKQRLLDYGEGSRNVDQFNEDMDEDDEDFEEIMMKNRTFEQIAAIDHFVSPMLKLPRRLQDRIASTEVYYTYDVLYIYLLHILLTLPAPFCCKCVNNICFSAFTFFFSQRSRIS